jgi:hypothetical protein
MSDEELRALERQVRAGAGVEVVLRWAEALDRAGRVEEAVDVTLGALAREPRGAARDALRKRPVWSTPSGGPGRTHAIDLLPIRRAPVERWRHESRTLAGAPPAAMGSWSGIVIQHGRPKTITTLLDPWTGAMRWSQEDLVYLDASWTPDDFLVLREREAVVVRYMRSLKTVAQAPAPPGIGVLGISPGLHVTFGLEGTDGQRLTAYRWNNLRRAPEAELCWTYEVPRDLRAERVVPAGRSLLVTGFGPQFVALDPSTGEERWVGHGANPMADDAGLLLMNANGDVGEWSMCTLEGEARWRRPDWTPRVALARDVVVGERVVARVRTIEVVDRASGETRATIESPVALRSLIVVGDVIYLLSSRGLEGFSLTGERLWRESRDMLGARSMALVPLDRHVIVIEDDGNARAFGESPG